MNEKYYSEIDDIIKRVFILVKNTHAISATIFRMMKLFRMGSKAIIRLCSSIVLLYSFYSVLFIFLHLEPERGIVRKGSQG